MAGNKDDITNKTEPLEHDAHSNNMPTSSPHQSQSSSDDDDIPDNFFDDFSNKEFMAGLDILDSWNATCELNDPKLSGRQSRERSRERKHRRNSPKSQKGDVNSKKEGSRLRTDRSYTRQSPCSPRGRRDRSPLHQRQSSTDKHNRRTPPRPKSRSQVEVRNRLPHSRERSPLRLSRETSQGRSHSKLQYTQSSYPSKPTIDNRSGREQGLSGSEGVQTRSYSPSNRKLASPQRRKRSPFFKNQPSTSYPLQPISPAPQPVPPPNMPHSLNDYMSSLFITQYPGLSMSSRPVFDGAPSELSDMKIDVSGGIALNKPVDPVPNPTQFSMVIPGEAVSDRSYSEHADQMDLIYQERTTNHLLKLFQEKKISLTEFLSVSAKEASSKDPQLNGELGSKKRKLNGSTQRSCETNPEKKQGRKIPTTCDIQTKIKVLSRCLDAMKVLGGAPKVSGRFFLKKVETGGNEVERLPFSQWKSPLRLTAAIQYRFTTPTTKRPDRDVKNTMRQLLTTIGLTLPIQKAAPVVSVPAATIVSNRSSLDNFPATTNNTEKLPTCKTCELRSARTFSDACTQTLKYQETVIPSHISSSFVIQDPSEHNHKLTMGVNLNVEQPAQSSCVLGAQINNTAPMKVSKTVKKIKKPKVRAKDVHTLTMSIEAGDFLKLDLPHTTPYNNPEERENSLRQLWFDKIHDTLLILLKRVMKFEVSEKQLKTPTNNEQTEIPNDVIECYQIKCVGMYRVDMNRKMMLKDIAPDSKTIIIDHEIAVSRKMNHSHFILADVKKINATLVVTSCLKPPRVSFEFKNNLPTLKTHYYSCATFLTRWLPAWLASAIRDLQITLIEQDTAMSNPTKISFSTDPVNVYSK